MKKSSKKKFPEKNNKDYKKNSDFGYYSKNANRLEKNDRFLKNSAKNKKVENLKKNDENNTVSSVKRRSPKFKSNKEFPNKNSDIHQEFTNKRNFDDWIWGKHSVYEALVSERSINRIWCTSEIFSSDKFYILFKELKSKGVLIEEVSWNRLSQLTSGASHQGVALQLACSKTVSLEQLIEFSKNNCANPLILALDGITDPHNVGAIIRSAEAFDCKGIIIPQRRSAGLTGTVAKVAAGALEHLHVSRVVNLNRSLEELKENGFLVVGLSGDSQLSISNFQEKAPLVVIVGSEGKGISLLTQKKCDYLLSIPLKGKTSSLNASVAAAISIFYLTSK
ncbi:23S rRNA (guanosine(2251)-2'-O)-methyltransferase RlmB [Prochlorococcus marinus XMU1414]|uniref:23S rRNA (Guanosine(2251)-2'-O)-methyltransferase RlmB n=1 Tax=Prochlorococcus marinus XMU1424 TaxID=2774497 RepID=A0A9D9BU59_PROMR|nr:23S rRNA (guanosine(2251)-2'-O)-methyltransferase RlmB [Prochlorococcus marinus]MBO8228154.1 23S rRNA (guanosine(2251)-2'-O)-methyltransferase RlmB [Prochlorococcus marinus XMU1414]MBW3045655.1 23S rRNA (guanosine(2251)-2'-O)-methyltransferase RlmB [Prochlorococcus marinus str. MU1414]MCR8532066.1 23S rRNA (guanosine(2251)-2'-O)-methyltransferase RlmB [Prochlorococcus marinus XMU1420]MCR8535593.1 23S rRNA (guanosine(2251)-2'-O)-methyltransferase RlmB [Prochlorococcus marinus XMU1424]